MPGLATLILVGLSRILWKPAYPLSVTACRNTLCTIDISVFPCYMLSSRDVLVHLTISFLIAYLWAKHFSFYPGLCLFFVPSHAFNFFSLAAGRRTLGRDGIFGRGLVDRYSHWNLHVWSTYRYCLPGGSSLFVFLSFSHPLLRRHVRLNNWLSNWD